MAMARNEGGRRNHRLPEFARGLGGCFERVAEPRADVTTARLAMPNEVLS